VQTAAVACGVLSLCAGNFMEKHRGLPNEPERSAVPIRPPRRALLRAAAATQAVAGVSWGAFLPTTPYFLEIFSRIGLRYGYHRQAGMVLTLPSSVSS